MAVQNPAPYLQARTDHTAQNDRLVTLMNTSAKSTGAFSSQGGVRYSDGNDLKGTQNGTPNMSVNIAAGLCYVPGTETALQGVYEVANDATLNVSIAAAHASLARKDAIVAKVEDSQYSGSNDLASIVAVTGTAAASPSLPTLPNNSLILQEVNVAAATTSITNANITDRRVAFGGREIVCASNTLPSSPIAGQKAYMTDLKKTAMWNGTVWITQSNVRFIGYNVINSATTNSTSSGAEAFWTPGYTTTTLVSGRRYHIMYQLRLNSTSGSATWTARIRVRQGSNPIVTDTVVGLAEGNHQTAGGAGQQTVQVLGDYTAPTSNSFTFGVSAQRTTGSGEIQMLAAGSGTGNGGFVQVIDIDS
jgi:hypothetical protein